MSKAQEILDEWGARKLTSLGLEFDEGSVNVTEETFSDGYCETCYYEYTGIAINYRLDGRFKQEEVYGRVIDVIDEALEGADW